MAPAVTAQLHQAVPTDPSIQKMFRAVEGGLGYQYHASWGLVLQVLAVFLEVCMKPDQPQQLCANLLNCPYFNFMVAI